MLLDIDIDKLTKLIKSFYNLTKTRVVLYDDMFKEVFCYPENHTVFCDMMNKIPRIHEKCNESARELCRMCKEKNEMVTFTCHAGLTEVVAPLQDNGVTIGYIMFGQITNKKDKSEFAKKSRQRCKDYNLDFEEFDKKIRTVQYKSNSQIEAISEITNAFAAYIYLKKIVSPKKEEKLSQIISYIDENLSVDLSVASICEKFSLSKTLLYEITKPAMPGGIAQYIRAKRIEKAKVLLTTTDKSTEEISGLVGFLDSNYFRRIFKKTCLSSANAYRKNNSK